MLNAVWGRSSDATSDEPTAAGERRRGTYRVGRRTIVLLVVALAGAATAAAVVIQSLWGSPPSASPPVTMPTTVHSLGYLEPRSEVIRLAAPSSFGEQVRVDKLLVAEGDQVAAGSLVARLDNYDRRSAAVTEAEARVEVEVARLEQIEAGAKPGDLAAQRAMISRANAVLSEAKVDLARSERLVSRNAAPAAELDDAKLRVESAREELSHAEATLESLAEVREVDVRQQQSQIAAAKAALITARAELETSEVRAPIDGRVLKINVRPGERIGDEGILDLGDTSEMYAVAEVYEADLPRVEIGQRATVRLFTGAGETLEGEVAEIGLLVAKKDVLANDPVADTDARVVEVRVRLKPEDARTVERLSNARVEVTIDSQTSPSK